LLTPTAFPWKAPLLARIADFAMIGASILLVLLSYFLCRGYDWARRVLMGVCVVLIIAIACAGFTSVQQQFHPIGQRHYQVALVGLIIALIAPPLFLITLLRQPDVVDAFRRRGNTKV
jgi:hypothetical protein